MPSSALAHLLAQLLVILAATRFAGYAIRPLGQPAVVGEMLAGIALGPSLLGALLPTLQQQLFPPDALLPLATLSQLNTRGLMELVILNVGLDIGVIAPPLFAMMVLMALTTTAMTSPLVSMVLKRAAVHPVARARSTGNLRI